MVYSCLSAVAFTHGGGRHLFYISSNVLPIFRKFSFISIPFAIATTTLSRASVAILIVRIIGPSTFWRKWFIYLNVISHSILSVIAIGLNLSQCVPMKQLWVPTPGAKCRNQLVTRDVNVIQTCERSLQGIIWTRQEN